MKKPLLLALFAGLLMTSCLKDGFNDFDLITHDIAIQGTVSPTLGVPVAYGAVTIYDVLQMVQVSQAEVEVGSDGIITVYYDTTISQTVQFDNSKTNRRYSRSKSMDSLDIVHVSRNSVTGSVNIDLFENIEFLENAEMEVDHLYVNIDALVKADAAERALAAMDSFHVHVFYDSLYIEVVGKDDSHILIPVQDTIPIDSLILGQNIKLFNNVDISDAINKRPKQILYGARMNIAFEAQFFATGMSENRFVSDSIGITAVSVDADIKVSFPISTYINNLNYSTVLKFEPSFNLGELQIDSSMLMLNLQNSIPLSLSLSAKLVDANNREIWDLLAPSPVTIEGAPVANDGTGRFSSSGSTNSLITIPVTSKVFEYLQKTKGIKIDAVLNTSPTGSSNKRVAVKSTDKLDIAVTAKLKPTYNLDMNVGGNGESGQKGGEQ